MKTAAVFGTGLIGGSFALALKRAYPGIRIAGVDRPEVIARAQKRGIIDTAGFEPSELIILATPIGEILNLLDRLPAGEAVVTDVGSTKAAICARAEQRGLNFVGGHPMAGLEHSGPEAANADLLREAPFFLCPVGSTRPGALPLMEEIVQAVGAVPHVAPAQEHDRIVAQISHLPQILSSILAAHTASRHDLAGPGLRSMTRLAGSPFHIWRDIFETSGFLPTELQAFIRRLQDVLSSMEAGRFDEIERLFKREDTD